MRVIFAGVGEAFDENLGNTTVLVTTGSGKRKRQILLDCGFTGAHAFWKASQDPMDLDAIWVSHFHGDHFFGVPLVLLRFWEQGRTKALTLVGQMGIEEKAPIIAARSVTTDEGQVLLLWVRQLPSYEDLVDIADDMSDDFSEDDENFDGDS